MLMQGFSVRTTCPVCGGGKHRPLIKINDAPLLCNLLHSSREEALHAPRGTIELVFCLHCGHLYNAAFDRERISYPPGYDNALHYSGHYRQYAEQEARRLSAAYLLEGRRVVDIGCGDGAFLELLRRLGCGECMGFEPARDSRADAQVGDGITIIPNTFPGGFSNIAADLYVARHVLEHLADPRSLLKAVRAAMHSDRPVLFLEVPDGAFLLAQGSVWDIIYEHVSCFTAGSLSHLLHLTGFSPDTPRSVFAGQYLAVDAFPAESAPLPDRGQIRNAMTETGRLLKGFLARSASRRKQAEKLLRAALADGRRAVIWGAGSKGVALLNSLPAGVNMPCIIDIHPGKQGKFVPVTGQQVMGPEFLADYRPETVFIVNNIYRGEIQALLDRLSIAARLHSI